MRHHRECDMAVPTVPVSDLILVQPRFALGLFDTLLNGVAGGGHLRQRQAAARRRAHWTDNRRSRSGRSVRTASNQPGVRPGQLVTALDHPLTGPVIRDQPFLALGYRQALPAALGPAGDDFFHGRSRAAHLPPARTCVRGRPTLPGAQGEPPAGVTARPASRSAWPSTYQQPLAAIHPAAAVDSP